MKKIRIASLVIAIMMLCVCFASCGGSSNQVNCKISIAVNGEYIVDHVECPVKSEAPVVMDALELALEYLGVDYELGSTNLKRIVVDGVEYAEGPDAANENHRFWVYTANGVEPDKGSAAVNALNEGDDIVFTYTSIPIENNNADADGADGEAEPNA